MQENMRHTTICTVGTSLLANLKGLCNSAPDSSLSRAYGAKDWSKVATELKKCKPTERLCGAEINSVTDLLTNDYITPGCLHLLHSDTEDGEDVAVTLKEYFDAHGWQATAHRINGLRDADPKAFRTRGLRNLAKAFGERVREAGGDYCAINATGGYKAQIAIAVLMGQALGIPVYYKHERFDAIIPFPPMPVALDFSLWQRASGMFFILSQPGSCEKWEQFRDGEWDERFEPLVNREDIDGTPYLELSATGQIFHETFCTRFQQSKAGYLPREARETERSHPSLGNHGYGQARNPIQRYLENLSRERPYIRYCHSTYWNPDLPESSRFRLRDKEVEGIYSNGTWCMKFRVITTANEHDDLTPVVADLNDWIKNSRV